MSHDELLDEIKRRLVSAPNVCKLLGIECERDGGGNFKILCPWHNEKTGSCNLRCGPDGTLQVRCFGCGNGGDIFSLIAALRGLDSRTDFATVKREAADMANISLDGTTPRGPRPAPPPRAAKAPPGPPNRAELAFDKAARALLALCPLSLEGSIGAGLLDRGILIEAQRDGWGELPPEAWELHGEELEKAQANGSPTSDSSRLELLRQLVIGKHLRDLIWLVRGGSIVHTDHRLCIPWRAPDGRINEFQRRYATRHGDGAEASPEKLPKYVFTSTKDHQPQARYAYGVDSPDLATAAELWLVEGAVDVLAVRASTVDRNAALAEAGKPMLQIAVLGIPGVSSWDQVSASCMQHMRGRVVRIALDRDEVRNEGVERAIECIQRDAQKAGAARAFRQEPPEGCKDWGVYRAKQAQAQREAEIAAAFAAERAA